MNNENKVIDEIFPIGFMKDEDTDRVVFLLKLQEKKSKQFVLINFDWLHKNLLKSENYIPLLRIVNPRDIAIYKARNADSFFEYLIPGYLEDGQKKCSLFTKRQISFDKDVDEYFLLNEDFTDGEQYLFLKNTAFFIDNSSFVEKIETEHKESIAIFLRDTEMNLDLFPFKSFWSMEIDRELEERT